MTYDGWVIEGPDGKWLFCKTGGWLAAVEAFVLFWEPRIQDILQLIEDYPEYEKAIRDKWRGYSRKGYRCVRVKFTEVE